MLLSELKAHFNIAEFNFNPVVTESGEVTDWFAHWDNINRRRFVLHKDMQDKLFTSKDLGLKSSTEVPKDEDKKTYEKHIICIFKHVEGSFEA